MQSFSVLTYRYTGYRIYSTSSKQLMSIEKIPIKSKLISWINIEFQQYFCVWWHFINYLFILTELIDHLVVVQSALQLFRCSVGWGPDSRCVLLPHKLIWKRKGTITSYLTFLLWNHRIVYFYKDSLSYIMDNMFNKSQKYLVVHIRQHLLHNLSY